MKGNPTLIASCLLAGLVLFNCSCSRSGGKQVSAPEGSEPAAADGGHYPVPDAAPDSLPMASLALANGNRVDIYDVASSVLFVESGKAGKPSGMPREFKRFLKEQQSLPPGDRLLAAWKRLAPKTPVPEAVKAFQSRWRRPPGQTPGPRAPLPLDVTGAELRLTRPDSALVGKQASPYACDNGCCESRWLSTFSECTPDWDVSWFLFNKGNTKANASDVQISVGMVCAASGTSRVNYRIGNFDRNLDIAAGTFRQFWWISGWSQGDLTSSVNSPASQALHTYCGDVER